MRDDQHGENARAARGETPEEVAGSEDECSSEGQTNAHPRRAIAADFSRSTRSYGVPIAHATPSRGPEISSGNGTTRRRESPAFCYCRHRRFLRITRCQAGAGSASPPPPVLERWRGIRVDSPLSTASCAVRQGRAARSSRWLHAPPEGKRAA